MSDPWPSEHTLIAMQAVVDELGDTDRANVLERAAKIRELASNGAGGVALSLVWSERQVSIDRNTSETLE